MKQGWEIKKFSEVFDLQMGKTPSRDKASYWNGDNAWVSIADLNDKKYISESKEGRTVELNYGQLTFDFNHNCF